jgi:uncharacterized DUF497 family protein
VLKRYRYRVEMEFAFDPAKSAANLRKHGIDFLAAQALWRDPSLLGFQPGPAMRRGFW